MTKVVDNLLRDSIGKYVTCLDNNGPVESNFRYQSALVTRKLKVPSIGQRVELPFGSGEVTELKYWKNLQDKLPQGQERESLRNRIEVLLGDVNRYFEYTVRYKEGDTCTFDWSEYEDNFWRKR